MAEVREGWDTRLNRPVAIKLLHAGLSRQLEVRERFRAEARAAAALNHPNIVRVYDFGDDADLPFLVTERLPGDTLADLLAAGPLPSGRVRAVLRDVLSALATAHQAGVLHRDIKPGNILLTGAGGVKVADFGIAKSPGSVHTTTGQLVGTLAYLSPSRITGTPATVADDLYAAAVVGYEALAGRKPYPEEDIVPLARAIVEGRPPSLRSLRPDADAGLVAVIERAMAHPAEQFGSAGAMRDAVDGGHDGWRPKHRCAGRAGGLPRRTDRCGPPAGQGRKTGRHHDARRCCGGGCRRFRARSAGRGPAAPDTPRVDTSVSAPISVTAVPPPPPVLPPAPSVAPTPEPAAEVEHVAQQQPIDSGPGNREPTGIGRGQRHGNGIGNGNGIGRGNGHGTGTATASRSEIRPILSRYRLGATVVR